jgi:hypothetical protein
MLAQVAQQMLKPFPLNSLKEENVFFSEVGERAPFVLLHGATARPA